MAHELSAEELVGRSEATAGQLATTKGLAAPIALSAATQAAGLTTEPSANAG
jgi:hypothetical protein